MTKHMTADAPILSAIGTSGPALSAAIRGRYHPAR